MSKVLLKSVPELMAEGWKFNNQGGLFSADNIFTIAPSNLHTYGKKTEVEHIEEVIKEHIKEEKTYSLTEDFSAHLDEDGTLNFNLKNSEDDKENEAHDYYKKIKLKP